MTSSLQTSIENDQGGALRALDRLAYEEDQLEFSQKFFAVREGAPFITAPHHKTMARTLDKVFKGKITRLIINIPPGFTKTQMCVVDFVARGLAINPRARFIHASYSESLVMDNSMAIKDTIGSKDYQALWPVKLGKDARSKGLWKTTDGGGFLARPAGGAITGFRAGRMEKGFTGALIIDDPLKPDDAERKISRENVNRRWDTTFKSRLAHEDVPVIVIMQRLHRDDFSGFLLRGGGGCQWHHLCLPVEIAKGRQQRHSHGRNVRRSLKPGPLWPEKMGAKDIEALKADAYTFSAQYMQRPITRGGSLFKQAWLKPYETLPDLEYRMIFADTAQKTGQEHDYSVFQCWGREHKGSGLYLIDQVRGKWEEPELIEVARQFWNDHANRGHAVRLGHLRAMAIEDKVSGTALIQHLGRDGIPVQAIKRIRDKRTRAGNVTPIMAGGKVFVPKHEHWYGDYEAELLSFPKGTHDDQVDPTIDAITFMGGTGMALLGLY